MIGRRIVFVVFPDFSILDLTGPHEVFTQAGLLTDDIVIETVAAGADPVTSSGGLVITPDRTIDDELGSVDTLVAVGGVGVDQACEDRRLVDWIARIAPDARRTASVCSGAFLLGAAGLLSGRRAATHWARCDQLAERYPATMVDPRPIFVRDGNVWTSAGVTAGIDLALAMVEDDHGPEVARTIARQLVMFVQRPGGQAQFSAQLAAQRPVRAPLREILAWIADHPGEDLTVPVLARRAAMSERNFTRVFHAETGLTPAAYVESVRVETAKRLLESTAIPVETVARTCGFGTDKSLQRTFKRTLQVTPGEYRRHFSAHTTAA
jgi:transcriptional regulator GlxA family with amidase domain